MSSEYQFRPCIGIISYLPDEINLKMIRIQRLNNLLKQIDYIFDIPIIIIAQHWTGISLREGTTRKPIIIHNYKDGLGINKARQVLREKFLESDFNYLIMLDDDSQLAGDYQGGQLYLNELSKKPDGFCEFKPSLLKLFAISKDMYSRIVIPDGGADDADPKMRFFEDQYICRGLKRVFPDKQVKHNYNIKLMELSNSAWDEANTGWHKVYEKDSEGKQWDRHDTGGNTRFMLSQLNEERLLNPEELRRRNPLDKKLEWWNNLNSVEIYDKWRSKL